MNKNNNWGIGLLVACGMLFGSPANAIDRVDPDGDFSNLAQRLIIKYRDNQARDMAAEARSFSAASGANISFVRSLAVQQYHLFELEQRASGQALTAVMSALARRPNVELVEQDRLLQPSFEPDDEFYANQWHYYEATGGINLPAAWDKGAAYGARAGYGAVVAVLDTGYTNHTDLSSNLLPGYDFIGDTFVANDGDGRDGDASDPGDWLSRWECGFRNPPRAISSSWHGTHTSGTVAAVTNNNQGVAGVAFDAMVVPVRVLGKCGGYISDIADAIIWASGGGVSGVPVNAHPADVINMSLGGSGACESVLQSAIDTARANGTTVVTSAGNSNANASGFNPANCAGVITVAANDRQGNRASYSNYGAVDVTAPGGETSQVPADGVASTLNDGATTPGNENYVYYQGTSMAAPHVAGAAALLYAVDPDITPNEVEAALEATARPLPGSCSGGCGAGIIDASAAIDFVTGMPINQRPTAAFTESIDVLTVTFTDTSTDNDGSIVNRDWDFGDGNTSTEQNPANVYAASGTYTVTLTVIDDGGATDSTSHDVTVDDGIAPPPSSISLSASGYKIRGRHNVDLTWSGAASNNVDVHRNGNLEATTANNGAYTDAIGAKGGATYIYKVCEAGTSTCSSDVTVVF